MSAYRYRLRRLREIEQGRLVVAILLLLFFSAWSLNVWIPRE